jgi:hypothetical protein
MPTWRLEFRLFATTCQCLGADGTIKRKDSGSVCVLSSALESHEIGLDGGTLTTSINSDKLRDVLRALGQRVTAEVRIEIIGPTRNSKAAVHNPPRFQVVVLCRSNGHEF